MPDVTPPEEHIQEVRANSPLDLTVRGNQPQKKDPTQEEDPTLKNTIDDETGPVKPPPNGLK